MEYVLYMINWTAYAQIAYNDMPQNNNACSCFGWMLGKMPQNNEFIKLFFVNITNERAREGEKSDGEQVIPKCIHEKDDGTMLAANYGQIKC